MRYWQVTGPITRKDGSEAIETFYVMDEEQPAADAVEIPRLPEPDEVIEGGEWVVPLNVLQARKWSEVKARRDAIEDGSASTPIGAVQCDDRSKIKISGLVTMAMLAIQNAQPFSEPFTLADNSVVTLDAAGAIAMGMAVGRFVSSVHEHARQLRELIFADDANRESVAAVNIEAGWPE